MTTCTLRYLRYLRYYALRSPTQAGHVLHAPHKETPFKKLKVES